MVKSRVEPLRLHPERDNEILQCIRDMIRIGDADDRSDAMRKLMILGIRSWRGHVQRVPSVTAPPISPRPTERSGPPAITDTGNSVLDNILNEEFD